MIKWILLVLCVYYFSLSSLDRKYIWLTIKNRHRIGNSDLVSLDIFFKFLLVPFCSKNYFSRITEGAIYASHAYEHFPHVTEQMNDKVFWSQFLPSVGVPTPPILYNSDDIVPDEYYIVKPRRGIRGKGVRKILGKYVSIDIDYVVQPIVVDCTYPGSRTFRIVTLYNGDLFKVAEYTNNKITSNHATGGHVDDDAVDKIEPSIIEKLLQIHIKHFPFIHSIGWDVMVSCDSYYVLEGNVFHGAFVPETTTEEKITEYKQSFNTYLNHRHLCVNTDHSNTCTQ